VSSPISFSGFNNIDFSSIVNSLMAAESQPLTNLQSQQTALQSKASQVTSLTSQVSLVQTAVTALSTTSSVTSFAATSSDSSAVAVTAGSQASAGHYDVVVQDLARAQVTASNSTAPDANTTVVASGGTLTIGGVAVTVGHDVTLQGLADTINATANTPVRASVVQSSATTYRLVLTANNSGTASAFTMTNALTGGAGVTFTDTDADGISGNSAADNAVQGTNASVLVNNVQITSSSNTLTAAIPGVTLSLFKKDPLATISVDVTADSSALKSKLSSFITAYNSLVSYAAGQDKSAGNGDASSLGRDPVLRQLRLGLRGALTGSYANTGPFKYLSELGVEFTKTGTLQLNNSMFNDAVASGTGNASKLLVGTGTPGAFASLGTLLDQFTRTGGVLASSQTQITTQISSITTQISNMQARLDAERASLQAEFTAADLAMSQLSSQSGSIAGLSTAKG
jgi:flagellar hook-associated protein 2